LTLDGRACDYHVRQVAALSTGETGLPIDPVTAKMTSVRLQLLVKILLLASVLVTLGCGSGKQPNILLISLDTLRADHLSSYGYTRPTSPFLDELAGKGVLFENAFVNCHSTAPSHMTMLSSRYQETHRVLYDIYGRAEAERAGKTKEWLASNSIMPENLELLQETVSRADYWSVAVTEGGFVASSTGINRGFDVFDDSARDVQRGADKLVGLIKGRPSDDGRPVFAFLHTYQIHGPYESPDRYKDLFGNDPALEFGAGETSDAFVKRIISEYLPRAAAVPPEVLEFLRLRYDRAIRYTDDVLRSLFADLREMGFFEDYVVIVTSDHGEEFGEHGDLQHTDLLFDGLVRVPLIVQGSGIQGAVVDDRMASTVDIVPTIVDLCGIEGPPDAEGRDLLSPPAIPKSEQFVFMQRGSIGYAIRTPEWKLIEGPPPHPYSRSSPLPLALYDLRSDPGEMRNVAERYPRRTKDLLQKLRTIQGRLGKEVGGESDRQLSTEDMERLKSLGYLQ